MIEWMHEGTDEQVNERTNEWKLFIESFIILVTVDFAIIVFRQLFFSLFRFFIITCKMYMYLTCKWKPQFTVDNTNGTSKSVHLW